MLGPLCGSDLILRWVCDGFNLVFHAAGLIRCAHFSDLNFRFPCLVPSVINSTAATQLLPRPVRIQLEVLWDSRAPATAFALVARQAC